MSFSAEEDGGGKQLNGDSGSRGMLASEHLFCSEIKPEMELYNNLTPRPSTQAFHHLQSM